MTTNKILEYAITETIKELKNNYPTFTEEEAIAFSIDTSYDADTEEFTVKCCFDEDYNMLVWIQENTDNETVKKLYNLDEKKIRDMALSLLTEKGCITGYNP